VALLIVFTVLLSIDVGFIERALSSIDPAEMENIALPVAFTAVLDSSLAFVYSLEIYVAPTVVLGTNQ
jgi:hypothetical protein